MIKPKTIGIQALAARWGCQAKQIIEAAIDGQIKLYFSLGYCAIADLPNPNPHHHLHRRPYQGSLQVDQSTLKDLLHTNEARHVKEAYTPEGAWVLVELPAQELPPPLGGHTMQTRIQQITPSLNIKTDDLHAFTEDVDAHESVDSASNETTPAPQAVPVAQPEAIDLSMLADPDQLIEAFGPYTKMDASWFDKWQDHPSLKIAIKCKGTPGRGRTTKPLFCPFLVMQGLMKKPRKGNKRQAFLNDETPWRMLKRYFPRVYDMHQGDSPLDD